MECRNEKVYKYKVRSAGGIVIDPWNNIYNPEKYNVLIIKQRLGDNWGLPKGHCEQGEDLEKCALREIREETGIDFIQLNSNMDESLVKEKYKKKNAKFIARKLAEAKALFISRENIKSYVIGADQICISKGKIFSKPKNKKKAIEQLSELNGKTHKLISAFSICYDNQVIYS